MQSIDYYRWLERNQELAQDMLIERLKKRFRLTRVE